MGRPGRRNTRYKTKRRKRDIDEIQNDLEPEKASKLLSQPEDEDKPGLAQFYCLECARYFVNAITLTAHKRSKPHKKRLKELLVKAYTQEDADKAGGLYKDSYVPKSTT